jgi:tetraacyldisaccharide 4'-kinase
VAILTRSDLVDAGQRTEIRRQFARYAPAAAWVEATYPPRALASADGHERDPAELKGRRVAAFCGIGNPAGFRHSLVQCGYEMVAMRELPDHFPYPADEVAELAAWVDSLKVAGAVCTSKDLVKIGDRWPGSTPLCALVSRLQIVAGQVELEGCLQRLVEQARSR